MGKIIYKEKVWSPWTSLLFFTLTLIFFILFFWRFNAGGFSFLPGIALILGLFFLFYLINYSVLRIRITADEIFLKFGVVRWKTKLSNIKEAFLDDSPAWIRYGGAGVHFAFVEGEYRAFYNLLEPPRIIVRFFNKQGPVQALVFTTRQPEKVLEIIQNYQEIL